MRKLSEMFKECAYVHNYEQAGNKVSYKFIEEGSTLYIYFEGSISVIDWIRNFLFKKRPYKDMKIPYKVHRGFLAAWKEVEDIIIAKVTEKGVKEKLNRKTKKIETKEYYLWKKIVIIGYSHGGALAAFCHECVWFWRPDLREIGLIGYGFEAPRMFGQWKMKHKLAERWNTFLIIRTNNDIVTHCPPILFGYRHVSSVMKIEGDTSLVKNKLPKFIKSHFPEVVLDALIKCEKEVKL